MIRILILFLTTKALVMSLDAYHIEEKYLHIDFCGEIGCYKELAKCKILIQMIEETKKEQRQNNFKDQLFTELELIQLLSNERLEWLSKMLFRSNLDKDGINTLLQEKEKIDEFLKEIIELKTFCDYK